MNNAIKLRVESLVKTTLTTHSDDNSGTRDYLQENFRSQTPALVRASLTSLANYFELQSIFINHHCIVIRKLSREPTPAATDSRSARVVMTELNRFLWLPKTVLLRHLSQSDETTYITWPLPGMHVRMSVLLVSPLEKEIQLARSSGNRLGAMRLSDLCLDA